MTGTQSPLKCDGEKIAAIEEAFSATWAVIQAHEPDRDLKYDCERMAALSQKLGELVLEGVTDPAQLRSLALEAWPLWKAPLAQ
jgi:hypothetical protein